MDIQALKALAMKIRDEAISDFRANDSSPRLTEAMAAIDGLSYAAEVIASRAEDYDEALSLMPHEITEMRTDLVIIGESREDSSWPSSWRGFLAKRSKDPDGDLHGADTLRAIIDDGRWALGWENDFIRNPYTAIVALECMERATASMGSAIEEAAVMLDGVRPPVLDDELLKRLSDAQEALGNAEAKLRHAWNRLDNARPTGEGAEYWNWTGYAEYARWHPKYRGRLIVSAIRR